MSRWINFLNFVRFTSLDLVICDKEDGPCVLVNEWSANWPVGVENSNETQGQESVGTSPFQYYHLSNNLRFKLLFSTSNIYHTELTKSTRPFRVNPYPLARQHTAMATPAQRLRAIHLYRNSLKNALSWVVRREAFYTEVRLHPI